MNPRFNDPLRPHSRTIHPVLSLALAGLLASLIAVGLACPSRQDRALASPPEAAPTTAAGSGESRVQRVRPSPLAGGWYEGKREKLHGQVHGALADVAPYVGSRPLALVCPHAGFAYSGPTAAHAYKTLEKERYDRIFILGPSHHVGLEGLGIGNWTHYETPLGRVPIDEAAVLRLTQDDLFAVVEGVDTREHSVEMQVPFVQVVAMGSRIVPIVVGDVTLAQVRHAAEVLRAEVGPGDLVVASTDFTHWGPRFGFAPQYDDLAAGLEQLDMGAFEALVALDEERFIQYCAETGAPICGARPVAILAAMLPEAAEVSLRHYARSGELTGDWENTVSYVAALATGDPWDGHGADDTTHRLDRAEQQTLLRLARDAITAELTGKPQPDLADYDLTEELKKDSGVFVTLTIDGNLRGCIGEIPPNQPLPNAVRERAVDAAIHDPRFQPLSAGDLDRIHIEVSALTPPRAVASYDDIVLGRDGVYLIKGFNRAVYLPQVAPEQGWDLEQTLSTLSRKAGLPSDGWKEGAEFEVFQAQVFHE